MPEQRTCSSCGALLPAATPGSQCAKCLSGAAPGGKGAEGANQAPRSAEGSTVLAVGKWPNLAWKAKEGPPANFGDFEFLSEGKEGGMGVVYRVRQLSLNRIVGLKMIRAGSLATDREVQRFRTEAEAAAGLDHPHIVPIYEVGEHQGRHYFTMKWIDGQSLDALSVARLVGAEPAAARLLVKIALAIQHAHERGILHRDLKPANILIDQQGEPHVTDFGLAKRLGSHPEMTASGAVMGTPSYMSPEQAEGKNKQLTTASDIFSLGTILYRLLTGKTPFPGETPLEIIKGVIENEPTRPSTWNSRINRDLETICLKCLRKDPQRRYPSARTLAADLEQWLAGKPIEARPVSDWERVWKWVRRHPAISALSSAVVLSILLGFLGVSWQWRRTATANARLQSQRADNFLAADKTHLALATVAQMIRENPRNRAAAERVINLLNQRVFLVPEASSLATNRLTETDSATDCTSGDHKLRAIRESTDARAFRVLAASTTNTVALIANAHSEPIRCLRFSPDGQRVLSASSDSTVKIWDTQNGALVHTLPHPAAVTWAEFSPDGARIVTATEAPDTAARLWNAATGKPSLADRMRHVHTVNSARFSPDGTLVATASDDGTARLWDAHTGVAYSEPVRLSQAVDNAAFGPDGIGILLTLENRQARAYRPTDEIKFFQAAKSELPTPEAIAEKNQALGSFANQLRTTYPEEITCLDFCPQRRLMATASRDKSARVWEAKTLHQIGVPLIHDTTVNCVRFSPDGLRLVTSTAGPITHVRIWDVLTGQPLSDPIFSQQPVAAVHFSADGRWIIADAGWKWRLFPLPEAAPSWLPELAEAVAGLRYSANGLIEPVPEEVFGQLKLQLNGADEFASWAREFLRGNSK